MGNPNQSDPYEAVLADLRAQRERISIAITTLEALRTGKPMPRTDISHIGSGQTGQKSENRPEMGPGAFLGMTIPDATKKLLTTRRQQMRTADITAELEKGGLVLTSADKVNTVGSVLLRRFQQTGDIVRVARGLWGLQEWYPGRKFPTGKAKGEDSSKGGEADEPESSEGNEAGNRAGNEAGTQSHTDEFADLLGEQRPDGSDLA